MRLEKGAGSGAHIKIFKENVLEGKIEDMRKGKKRLSAVGLTVKKASPDQHFPKRDGLTAFGRGGPVHNLGHGEESAR